MKNHAEIAHVTYEPEGGVRKFLYSCRDAVFAIRAIERQRDSVRLDPARGYKGVVITDMPRGTNDPLAAALDQLDGYDKQLLEARNELVQRLIVLEQLLTRLTSDKDKAIIRYFFGQGKTDAFVAADFDMDESTIRSRRRAAIKRIERKQ